MSDLTCTQLLTLGYLLSWHDTFPILLYLWYLEFLLTIPRLKEIYTIQSIYMRQKKSYMCTDLNCLCLHTNYGYFNVSQQVFLRYRIADDFVYVVMKRHLCVEARLSALSAANLTSNGLIDRFGPWLPGCNDRDV